VILKTGINAQCHRCRRDSSGHQDPSKRHLAPAPKTGAKPITESSPEINVQEGPEVNPALPSGLQQGVLVPWRKSNQVLPTSGRSGRNDSWTKGLQPEPPFYCGTSTTAGTDRIGARRTGPQRTIRISLRWGRRLRTAHGGGRRAPIAAREVRLVLIGCARTNAPFRIPRTDERHSRDSCRIHA
jgi:hypothetical protein